MRQYFLVVIPSRNEENNISDVILSIPKFLNEVLVVNDGSTDRTKLLAEKAGARVISTPKAIGYGSAIRHGIEYALCRGFKCIITIDGDGAHDPNQIPALLNHHIKNECDLTIGNRFTINKIHKIPSTKRWANFFATCIINKILHTSLSDVACGFRVLSMKLIKLIQTKINSSGFGFAYEIINIAKTRDFNICSFPVNVHYDASKMLYSSQNEIIDFLTTTSLFHSCDSHTRKKLQLIKSCAIKLEPITIVIAGITLCLHPILNKGYFIQAQDIHFSNCTIGSKFTVNFTDN